MREATWAGGYVAHLPWATVTRGRGRGPTRIAILDNFCWGYTDRPETLGSLVRASLACYDAAVALGTPFISGKDSLNNEYSYLEGGVRKTIQNRSFSGEIPERAFRGIPAARLRRKRLG